MHPATHLVCRLSDGAKLTKRAYMQTCRIRVQVVNMMSNHFDKGREAVIIGCKNHSRYNKGL
nr:hypothetical protein YSBCXYJI_YSBCXYJI_CDS_0062 [Caudoviricetes sp.]